MQVNMAAPNKLLVWLYTPKQWGVSALMLNARLTLIMVAYILAVWLAGFLLLVTQLPVLPTDSIGFLAFLLMGGLAQLLPIQFYKNASVSLSMAVVLATIMVFGPAYAMWVNVASGVVHYLTMVRPKQRPTYRSITTTSILVLAAFFAGQSYLLTGGIIGHGSDSFQTLLPLAVATLSYYVINTLLVTLAISLETHQNFWRLLRTNYQWLTVNIASLTPLGFGISFIYQRIGFTGLILFTLPIVIAWYSFKLYGRSVEDVRRANDELKQANEQVSLINSELTSAHDHLRETNLELRRANERLNIMYEVSSSLLGSLHLDETLDRMLAATKLMNFPGGFVVGPLSGQASKILNWRATHPAFVQWQLVEMDKAAPTRLRQAVLGLQRASWFLAGELHCTTSAELALNTAEYTASTDEASLSKLTFIPLFVRGEPWGLVGVGSPETPSPMVMKELLIFRSLAESALEMTLAHEQAQRDALIDARTGLYNHRYLQEALQRELQLAAERDTPLSFLMIDINNFKVFNDTYGHLVGDQVLQVAAQILRDSIRETDIACRYGGDELCVILPRADRASALDVATRIDRAVRSYRFLARREQGSGAADAEELSLRVSIGTATFPSSANTRAGLIEQADRACYRAKAVGGGVAAESRHVDSNTTVPPLTLVAS